MSISRGRLYVIPTTARFAGTGIESGGEGDRAAAPGGNTEKRLFLGGIAVTSKPANYALAPKLVDWSHEAPFYDMATAKTLNDRLPLQLYLHADEVHTKIGLLDIGIGPMTIGQTDRRRFVETKIDHELLVELKRGRKAVASI